jgi:TetR/AcrR family transcriptional regulator, fatty acid metabolism regulator protein
VAEIMAAARQVIAEKGYENALMSEIAERAGIVEGTLYRYFDNKRDLLSKVTDDWFEEVLSTDAVLPLISGTWHRLRHLIWRGLATIRRQPALSRYVLLELRRDPDYRSTRLFSLNRRFTSEVAELFEAAVSSGEFRSDVSITLLRDMVFGGIEHSTWKFLRGEGDFQIDDVADGIATVVYRGMLAEQPSPHHELDSLLERFERTAARFEGLVDAGKKCK